MLSDPGRVRRHNEDACAASAEHGVFVICDGVGGAASGEVASRIAADALLSHVVSAQVAGVSPEFALQDAIQHANQLVHRQARQSVAQRGMATTLVALVFSPGSAERSPISVDQKPADGNPAGTVFIAHVGDSRCYRLRERRFEQLTRDHSVVEEQVRSGALTRAQAEVSPIRNVITRAIGSDAAVEPDLGRHVAHHGDLYLLCSDGLTRDLADDEIAAILQSGPFSDRNTLALTCELLVHAGNDRGGGDNLTCLLVEIT